MPRFVPVAPCYPRGVSAFNAAAELVSVVRDRLEKKAGEPYRYDFATGEALIILQWALDHAASGDEAGAARMIRCAISCLVEMPIDPEPMALHRLWKARMGPLAVRLGRPG